MKEKRLEIVDERDGMIRVRLICGHLQWTTKERRKELLQHLSGEVGE